MFRRITLSILALGFLVATADAAQMTPTAAPVKPVVATETSHLVTGRSAHHAHGGHMHMHHARGGHMHRHMMRHGWHRHWHHGWYGHRHPGYGWHHGWHCHHRWYR